MVDPPQARSVVAMPLISTESSLPRENVPRYVLHGPIPETSSSTTDSVTGLSSSTSSELSPRSSTHSCSSISWRVVGSPKVAGRLSMPSFPPQPTAAAITMVAARNGRGDIIETVDLAPMRRPTQSG